MHTNVYGNTVIDSWQWLATQYPYVDLDHFVLMPNHLHGIILIDDMRDADKMRRGGSRTAPTAESVKRKPLGRLIGAFKTVSTKQINLLRNTPRVIIWQRSFFDRIIRNENELNRIREYIHFNPLKWNQDKENPENPKIP